MIELHHDHGTDGHRLVVLLAGVQQTAHDVGHQTLLAVRAVVGAYIKVVADSPHLLLEDYQVLVAGTDYHVHLCPGLMQVLHLGIYGGSSQASRYEEITAVRELLRAQMYKLGRLTERPDHIREGLSGLIAADDAGRGSHELGDDGHTAFLAVVITDGQGDALILLPCPDYQKLSRLG